MNSHSFCKILDLEKKALSVNVAKPILPVYEFTIKPRDNSGFGREATQNYVDITLTSAAFVHKSKVEDFINYVAEKIYKILGEIVPVFVDVWNFSFSGEVIKADNFEWKTLCFRENYKGKKVPEILDMLGGEPEKIAEIKEYYKKNPSLMEKQNHLGGSHMGYNIDEFVKNNAREENYVGGLTPYVSEQGNLSIPFTFARVEEKAGIKYLSRDAKEINRDGKIFIPTALFDTTTALGRSFKAAIMSAFEQAPEVLKKLAENKSAKELEKERKEATKNAVNEIKAETSLKVINLFLEQNLVKEADAEKAKLHRIVGDEKFFELFPADKPAQA